MTIKQFLKELKQAGIKFKINKEPIFSAPIRTCYGKCPIEALYRNKQHRSAEYEYAAELLGLSWEDKAAIVHAADHDDNSILRKQLMKACGVRA